nr:putative reverse transcriptase domain-containing protein [Tanacetum cinerariifolium]
EVRYDCWYQVEEEIIRDLERQHGYWASLRVEPDLISRIKEAQKEDSEIWTIVENLDKQVEFHLDDDNVLWQDTRGYKYHPLHVISYPLDQICKDLSYDEEPEAILDRQDRVMRKKII